MSSLDIFKEEWDQIRSEANVETVSSFLDRFLNWIKEDDELKDWDEQIEYLRTQFTDELTLENKTSITRLFASFYKIKNDYAAALKTLNEILSVEVSPLDRITTLFEIVDAASGLTNIEGFEVALRAADEAIKIYESDGRYLNLDNDLVGISLNLSCFSNLLTRVLNSDHAGLQVQLRAIDLWSRTAPLRSDQKSQDLLEQLSNTKRQQPQHSTEQTQTPISSTTLQLAMIVAVRDSSPDFLELIVQGDTSFRDSARYVAAYSLALATTDDSSAFTAFQNACTDSSDHRLDLSPFALNLAAMAAIINDDVPSVDYIEDETKRSKGKLDSTAFKALQWIAKDSVHPAQREQATEVLTELTFSATDTDIFTSPDWELASRDLDLAGQTALDIRRCLQLSVPDSKGAAKVIGEMDDVLKELDTPETIPVGDGPTALKMLISPDGTGQTTNL